MPRGHHAAAAAAILALLAGPATPGAAAMNQEPGPAASPGAAGLLLRLAEAPGDRAGDTPLPAAVDLKELRVRQESLALDASGPRPVLVLELLTSESDGDYPAGARFDLDLRFGPWPGEAQDGAHLSLTAALEEPATGSQRRLRSGAEAAAVLRFSGLEGLGDLGSMEPGRSVTFRVPLDGLLGAASAGQLDAARRPGGGWLVSVAARSQLGRAGDRLPRAGGAPVEIPAPPRP